MTLHDAPHDEADLPFQKICILSRHSMPSKHATTWRPGHAFVS
jgi:hypothetical protein